MNSHVEPEGMPPNPLEVSAAQNVLALLMLAILGLAMHGSGLHAAGTSRVELPEYPFPHEHT